MQKSFPFIAVTVVAVLLFFFSCTKDNNNNSTVPATYVDFSIVVTDPLYNKISVTGGWMYVTGGVRGIILYRKSPTEMMAYDRNCTYDPNEKCATVKVDNTAITAVDTCCKSKFLLTDGSVTNAPASLPLRHYETTFDGTNLRVYSK